MSLINFLIDKKRTLNTLKTQNFSIYKFLYYQSFIDLIM